MDIFIHTQHLMKHITQILYLSKNITNLLVRTQLFHQEGLFSVIATSAAAQPVPPMLRQLARQQATSQALQQSFAWRSAALVKTPRAVTRKKIKHRCETWIHLSFVELFFWLVRVLNLQLSHKDIYRKPWSKKLLKDNPFKNFLVARMS